MTTNKSDVEALVEALEGALEKLEEYAVVVDWEWGSCRDLEGLEADGELPQCIIDARAALAAYREQEGELWLITNWCR